MPAESTSLIVRHFHHQPWQRKAIMPAVMFVLPTVLLLPSASGQELLTQVESSRGVIGGGAVSTPNWAPAPPVPTTEQMARLENGKAILNRPPVNLSVQTSAVAGPFGIPESTIASTGQGWPGELQPVTEGAEAAAAPVPMAAASVLVSSPLFPTSGKSTITEPSVAQSGRNVFVTGNWFAARSINGGSTWTYISPYADMPDFCCDQDVIADAGRDMIMWYRQGLYSSSTGQSRFKLSVSINGGATFCTYDYRPTNLNSTFTGRWWDYPALALTDNYLYIATSIFLGSGAFDRKVILRWPLDSLRTCSGFGFNYLNGATSGWATVAQGATTMMYIGDHRGTNTSFRVFRWPENSTSYTFFDRTIPAFTFENGNGTCITPDGLNPCARGDSRLLAGWVRKGKYQTVGEVGFMWNARQGGGFPYPYTEAVTLREDTLAITGRPILWSSAGAWQYVFATPNYRGDLGLTATFMGGTWYPSTIFLINDDLIASGWDIFTLRAGNRGATAWGDYIRNRMFLPSGLGWVTVGHTQQGGTTGASTEPRYYVIARPRDVPSVSRYRLTP